MEMKPDRYCFPALFGYYDDGHVSVVFPDLPGCVSCGKTFNEAIKMAREALGGHLACMEDDGDEIPVPSVVRELSAEKHQVAVMVDVLMPFYRESERNAVVRKNVTIPKRLALLGEESHVNFSHLLSEALSAKLGVSA